MCCASRFCMGGGELRAGDPSNFQGPIKQNASPGEQSEAPKPAGRVLRGFHHVGRYSNSKSVNMSTVDTAMGGWVSMLCGHFPAGVKDVFQTRQPNCLVLLIVCASGRRRSVTCAELVNRFASMQGIDCCVTRLSHPTWGRLCSTCEHCSPNAALPKKETRISGTSQS